MNATAVAALEKDLDPNLPSNRKTIASCERDWEKEQLMGRLNIWGYLLPALVSSCSVFLQDSLIAVGIKNLWIQGIIITFFVFLSTWIFRELLWHGWMPWFLRDLPQEKKKE